MSYHASLACRLEWVAHCLAECIAACSGWHRENGRSEGEDEDDGGAHFGRMVGREWLLTAECVDTDTGDDCQVEMSLAVKYTMSGCL